MVGYKVQITLCLVLLFIAWIQTIHWGVTRREMNNITKHIILLKDSYSRKYVSYTKVHEQWHYVYNAIN